MKKILFGLALIIITTALFSQNLTFVSDNIFYDVFGESGGVEKESVVMIYTDRATIIQTDETFRLFFVTEMEKSNIAEAGGISTIMVLCKDERDQFWLLGISNVKELEQHIVTIYQDSDAGVISLMFFGYFKEDPKFKENEKREIVI